MSINFPTAFWKNQPEEADLVPTDVEDTQITWSKYLYYGYNNPEIVEGSDPVEYINDLNPQDFAQNELSTTSTFPFNDYSEDGEENPNGTYFYPEYYPTHSEQKLSKENDIGFYAGWYLAGQVVNSVNYTNDVHRADPWIVSADTREINLFFEADPFTADDLVWFNEIGVSTEPTLERYNHFVQTGYAEGAFTLGGTGATLRIFASGLGEKDSVTDFNYDFFEAYVDTTLICKGRAPENNDQRPWDQDHAIFTDAAGSQSPANYYTRKTSVRGQQTDIVKGNGATALAVVDQDLRTLYCKEVARFTGSIPLGAGDHKIKLYYNTNDGLYNSGAFYGTKFTFS